MLTIPKSMIDNPKALDILQDGEYVMIGHTTTMWKARETFKDSKKIIAFVDFPFVEMDKLFVLDKEDYLKYWGCAELKGENK